MNLTKLGFHKTAKGNFPALHNSEGGYVVLGINNTKRSFMDKLLGRNKPNPASFNGLMIDIPVKGMKEWKYIDNIGELPTRIKSSIGANPS